WGFDGFVVSDWGGSNDHVEGVRAGSHMEMPSTGGDSDEELIAAVKAGKIDEALIDRRVDELLDVILSTRKAVDQYKGKPFDQDAHHALARKASEQSNVLLKNEGNLLPLKAGTKAAVIGEFAQNARYQGAGSSVVNCTKLDHAMDVIANFGLDIVGYEAGYPRTGPGDAGMVKRAVALAKQADVVLLYIGLDEISESEGLDRPNMKLPQSQIDLLDAVAEANGNIVAVLAAGSAIEMPWLSKCRAMVHGCLHGQAGASAVLEAIMGDINPSGKLSETYPLSYEDVPSAPYFPAKERTVEYREGLYVGYRYYETVNKPVLFPFGFGLSYTTFQYSDLKVTPEAATFSLTNTGSRDGAEVAQLYVHAKAPSVYRPAKELKGFTKVFLKAGETKQVTIPLDDKAFRYFNVKTDKFEIDGGEYNILIGASAADIRLTGSVTVKGTDAPAPYDMDALPDYRTGDIRNVPDREFEALLGRPIPDGRWTGDLRMNDALCQLYYAKSLKARLVYKVMTGMLNRSIQKGEPDLNIIFVYNMPFRGIGKMTGGMVSQEMCRGIVKMVNGHAGAFFSGLGQIAGGYFKQRKVAKKAEKME
ncbi:MAG: glycoside hydrolase family 3 C-terminal domain-containing protein, partial [Oscillibacter sp.]|nr:glycoside hydrolase family 3 C-terminal domain-containing protein [Oscillibacter sp.]